MFLAYSIAELCDRGTESDLIDSLREGNLRPVVFGLGSNVENGRFCLLGFVEQPCWDSIVFFGE